MNRYLVLLASLIHLVPHPFGMSPVGAIAIYAGAHGRTRLAWLTPAIPLLLANAVAGFYDPVVMLFVYAGIILSAGAGRLLRKQQNAGRIALAGLLGAFVFYLVSNFSIWLVGMYPGTLSGLLECYVNGLPYLGTAIAANVIYGTLLLVGHRLFDEHESHAVRI